METIAAVNAALALIKVLLPEVEDLFKKGMITPEEQQKMLDDYNNVKNNLDALMSGPEWAKDS